MMDYNYLGIISEYNEYQVGEDTFFLVKSLQVYCKIIYIFVKHDLSDDMIDLFSKLNFVVLHKIDNDSTWINYTNHVMSCSGVFDGILYLDTSFFGPLLSWNKIFKKMVNNTYDYWGLLYRYTYKDDFGSVIPMHLEESFIFISKRVFSDNLFKYIISKSNNNIALSQFLNTTSYVGSSYIKPDKFISDKPEDNFDILTYAPYDLLKYFDFPIISKRIFEDNKIEALTYNMGNQPSNALKYIKKNQLYNIDLIWKFAIQNCNMSVIRRNLNLNYIISHDKLINEKSVYSECAVAVHLYYKDLISECMDYIKEIPSDIYLVISVAQIDVYDELQKQLKLFRANYDVIFSSNVGRDWGAFILDLWKYVKDYKYICFLHDKKSTGGKGYPIVGNSFMHYAWDNLIKNESIISQIIHLFIRDKYLGIISPSIPYHSGYIKLLGDSWTSCYDKTMELAKAYNAESFLEKSHQPFALSSCFWFRRSALDNLLNTPFKNEQFPKEPMATDGTFNHALERIIIYIAQSNGFYSASVLNSDYASNNLINYEFLLSKLVADSLQTFGVQSMKKMFDGDNYKNRIDLIKFTLQNKRLCIYGQGNNGKNTADFLDKHKICYEYFVVSDGYEINRVFNNHDTYYLCERLCDKDSVGVLVSVDNRYITEVISNLESVCWKRVFIVD